jgi:hypothetical protein
MAKEHVPRRGPNQQWVYPSSEAVLEECGMHTIGHYIDVRRETIAKYVVGCSILVECQGTDEGAVRCLGSGGGSRGCAWTTFETIGSRD